MTEMLEFPKCNFVINATTDLWYPEKSRNCVEFGRFEYQIFVTCGISWRYLGLFCYPHLFDPEKMISLNSILGMLPIKFCTH